MKGQAQGCLVVWVSFHGTIYFLNPFYIFIVYTFYILYLSNIPEKSTTWSFFKVFSNLLCTPAHEEFIRMLSILRPGQWHKHQNEPKFSDLLNIFLPSPQRNGISTGWQICFSWTSASLVDESTWSVMFVLATFAYVECRCGTTSIVTKMPLQMQHLQYRTGEQITNRSGCLVMAKIIPFFLKINLHVVSLICWWDYLAEF